MSYISETLSAVLAIDPEAEVIDYQDVWYSWAELARSISAISGLLDALDLGPDSRIGIMIRNRPDSAAAILATAARDSCIVTINPLMPKEKLNADLERLELPVVIGEPDDLNREGALDILKAAGTAVIETEPFLKGAHFRKGFEAITGENIDRTQPGTIIEMLTSGTTGTPKRIPIKRHSFVSAITAALAYEKGRTADEKPRLRSGTELLSNPLAHIGGMYFILTGVLSGRKLCLQDKFSVEGWRHAIVRHRPKLAGGVPAALRMILEANIPKEDLSSLVALRSGTAPLDPEIVDEFMRRYDLPVMGTYGATEFAGAVSMWQLKDFRENWHRKRGSVGKLTPGVEGRVIDPETGEEVPAGEEGVLELKAGQIGDGKSWTRTTDRAILDEDGYLFIKGRADNAIIRGGFKVHPDDVVEILHQHPAVREAVVVGIPDERLGAVPAAVLMLKEGAEQPDVDELKAFVKERALPYQVPVQFRFANDVPRTPSMKPALPLVREMFADKAA
jgi:acyl-coenzyme A synthetase/AMP-(fatty) acid ligase